MALRYLLDENVRGLLWYAILDWNRHAESVIEAGRVGDFLDLPLSSDDPDILRWCERDGRVLVTFDHDTMPGFLKEHLDAGGHLPGMFVIRPRCFIPDILDWLVEAAESGDDDQWRDQVVFIP